MPRIPNRQIPDEWDYDDEDIGIEDDEPKDRRGRRLPREDREWEERRRDQWRKRPQEDY